MLSFIALLALTVLFLVITAIPDDAPAHPIPESYPADADVGDDDII